MTLRAMLVGLAVAMCGAGATKAVNQSDALVAAYSFDAGSGSLVADASGNGNDGAVTGATWTTSGKNKGALTFDGVDDWVTVPDTASLDLSTGMTLEAWVRPAAIGGWRTVLAKERSGGIVYTLHASQEDLKPVGQVDIDGEQDAVGPSSLPLNAWTHLAATYDGTTVRLYVNGALAGSSTYAGSIPASSGPLRLGGNSIWSEWFRGELDDVRVYGRALSAAELQTDMSTPVGTAPATDSQAPSAPAGLSVSGQTQTALTLSWNAPTDNVGVTGYNLYRGGNAVGSNNASTRTYTFSGLSCGTTYALAVDAVDAAGNRSTQASANGTTTACPAPEQPGGLVAAYSFNGGSGSELADSSGKGNAGTISGPSWTTAGKNGGALTFDGVNDLVTVQDSASLDLTTAMTLEAWIRPTTGTSWRTVVTKEQPNNLVYGLFANSDAAHPSSIVSIGSNPVQDIVRGSAALPASTWTHLATTYDGSQLRLFVNGSQVGSRAVTGVMASSNKPLQIGGNKVWPEWFKGEIDDVRVYNRALNASELQTDMNTPVGGTATTPPPPTTPPPAPSDTQAPSTPAGLAVSGQSQTAVTLGWNASTDNVGVAGYDTFRGATAAGSTASATRTYAFSGLACGTSYALGVEARDAAGNRSSRASITGSTSPCSIPTPTPTPTPTPPAGTINVPPSGNLNTAYSQAQDGWVIQLSAGDYGIWRPAGGSKQVTIKGVSGTRFRQLYSQFDNVTFDGLDIDAGGIKTSGGAAFESHGDNATFKNGRIGNVTDEKGALISGTNFTFDNVVFHDVWLRTSGVHNECVYAIVVPGFTIRNSTFTNCATMDLFFTYGDWWSPRPPAYGNVTIENNRFGSSRFDNGVCCHYYGLYIGNVAYPAPGTLNGWKIRNNWFENGVAVAPSTGSGNVFCGNTGKPMSGWSATCPS
jgi:chitodextrinase